MHIKRATACCCVLLSGCAWNTDVLNVGTNLYQVSSNASPIRGGETAAREMALKRANKHCDKLNGSIEVQSIETSRAFPSNGVATVTFSCSTSNARN